MNFFSNVQHVFGLDRTIKLFIETGSPKNEHLIAHAEEIMEETLKTSIRQQINLSVESTHKLLRKDLEVHPYRITAVQELLPVDFPRRLEFCNWFGEYEHGRKIGSKNNF